MLSRLLPKPSHFRLLSNLCSKSHFYNLSPHISNSTLLLRHFSSNQNNNNNNNNNGQSNSNIWKLSSEEKFDSFFDEDSNEEDRLGGITDSSATHDQESSWLEEKEEGGDDIFQGIDKDSAGDSGWLPSEEGFDKAWSLDNAENEEDNVFDITEVSADTASTEITSESVEESQKIKEQKLLEQEEQELTAILKGPNRAFGDLIAASGITDAMLDSLIALRDFEGVEGLPPLSEIEDMRNEKKTRKSIRAEIERQKQEEVAKSRVRQVDDKGRAYGTGRRKCSVARVWIEPGNGSFIVNDKQFDVYFPMLDHRAALLRPFSETKTLGLWDVKCTVKGGGTTGQVGAIQLGISRAIQNWEPDLRPPLKNAGFLTRDPRVVERKKPGKAKARKSFQWVKR